MKKKNPITFFVENQILASYIKITSLTKWLLKIKRHNVCFRPWTGEKDYIKIVKRPHKGDDFCSSRIGMITGKQYMVLNRDCFDYGEIIHVFFHAFGILHENNHPDQENYIKSQ